MVAKSLFTAAFLLSCTLAWGECLDGKCTDGEKASGKCKSAECEPVECSSGERSNCGDDRCCSEEKHAESECSLKQCVASQCSKSKCSKGDSSKNECSKGGCSLAKRMRDESAEDCCAGGACPLAKCASEAFASLKCAVGACSSACSDDECCRDAECSVADKCSDTGELQCGVDNCPDLECASAGCGASTCVAACAKGSCFDAKLDGSSGPRHDVTERLAASGCLAQMKVDVRVVELNVTKCRKLGFEIETSHGATHDSRHLVGVMSLLEKNNLVKSVASPTLLVTSGRPASFRSGCEIPSTSGSGEAGRQFVGTSVDVNATLIGDDRVRVEIRPEISELGSQSGDGDLVKVNIRCWDTAFVGALGKTIVMKGLVEPRVRAVRREENGKIRVTEEVEEIETVLMVTVESADAITLPATISQTTYEESLVSLVQEPECVTKVYPVPDLQVWKVRPGGIEFDADLLVSHLKSAVVPNSWRSEANPGADAAIKAFERNGSLVISQTKENHRAIAEMLSELRGCEEAEENVSINAPYTAPKAQGKCAESQETLKCSAVDGCTTEVKLAFGKRFVELPSAEVEDDFYPIGECSTGFSVEPRCQDGQRTR